MLTGSSPFNGGEFGKYITSGYSGGLFCGSHPKNVGRMLIPALTRSSSEFASGGKDWCYECISKIPTYRKVEPTVSFKSSDVRFSVLNSESPLEGVEIRRHDKVNLTYVGKESSVLASTLR